MARELPPLNALRAFEAAARLESATRAAAELHVTHGAVSRQIRALEDTLGLAVFSREGRGLTLTPAGRRLRDATSAAFDQLRACCDQLRRDLDAAPLVLGCPGSVLARWMIPRLERMRRELPALTLNLSVAEAFPKPALPGLDAALMIAEPASLSAWRVHTLASELIAPVFSPHHPRAAALRKANSATLASEALLHTASRPQAWPAWARAQRVALGKLRFGQSFEHLYYMLEAAVAGLGVAIAPQRLVADDLAAGRLIAPWKFRATEASWVLCTPKSSSDPRIASLVDWLRQALATTPAPRA
ncbi:MAG TPA: LysR family transcriptional regulator [Rhodanobacteraceae bacterium]|nr:LysR family transcriptional regulator [Rhodanobacteraceae bacterium]